MNKIKKIAFIGNSLPRRCGIATFTNDIESAISENLNLNTSVFAMTDSGQSYDYPKKVIFEIHSDIKSDYLKAANFINNNGFEIVCLQHEFGIFGGEAGENILLLLDSLKIPIVTTLHTIIENPLPKYSEAFQRIIKASAKLIVMAQKGSNILQEIYGVKADKIEVIAHGIPDLEFIEPEIAKHNLGRDGQTIILTFGLLSASKGIDLVIDAMPQILKSCPNATYIVLGATHPNLVRNEGEKYRNELIKKAADLGVSENVIFIDEFVNLEKLVEYLSACDVYITPYLNEAQMTSGTLAYSFGLGNVVVSTPYWHAKELLDRGRGILVPFNDSHAIGREVSKILKDEKRRNKIRKTAFIAGRAMIWPCIAQDYMKVFERAVIYNSVIDFRINYEKSPLELPRIKTDHLSEMCDDTGIIQHAIYRIPDRAHGYCVDDNARALLLSCQLNEANLPNIVKSGTFSSFVQHAWNKDTGRFRNFMSFSRNWLEDMGSEDSHGRTLWALGNCAKNGTDNSQKTWAKNLFNEAYKSVIDFTSPRAIAFTLLGFEAYPIDKFFAKMLATRLMFHLEKNSKEGWYWFEKGLSYENARLSQALICSGKFLNMPQFIEAGLKTLKFIMDVQKSKNTNFRPYATEGFFEAGISSAKFDQQPVEAQASISACLSAYQITNDEFWYEEAKRAFSWFLGKNDLGIALIDPESGACFDGLHVDRVNENCGAESVLAYLLSLCDMNIFAQIMPKALKKENIAPIRNIETPRAFTSP